MYPPLASLPEHILPHHGALGDHRPLNQPLRAETIASNSVRAYVPGDPLRNIHWRTTARRVDPFVKVFNPEAASNVWLIPDFDERVHTGENENSSQETMVSVAASLAARLLQQNLSVGLFASAERETVVLPRQGQVQLWPILQALAPLEIFPGPALDETIGKAASLLSGSDLIVVVTPSLNAEWIAPLRRIARSRGGSGRAEVILLDAAAFEHAAPEDAASAGNGDGRAAAQAFQMMLIENGITANVIGPEDVRLISGYYGELSRWEFSIGGTGRAIARRTPRLAEISAGTSRPWE